MAQGAPEQADQANVRDWLVDQFDSAFYRKQLRKAGIEPPPRALKHYLEEGWRAGFDPSPAFSGTLYLAAHADARAADCSPLEYHAAVGRFVGAEVFPSERDVASLDIPNVDELRALFDESFYRAQLTVAVTGDPLAHYLNHGWRQGLNPSASFDTSYYLTQNPDVAEGGINPLLHFVQFGRAEGRRTSCPPPGEPAGEDGSAGAAEEAQGHATSVIGTDAWAAPPGPAGAFFDPAFYAGQLTSLPTDMPLYRHFNEIGWKHRLDPSPHFSTGYYLDTNPEVASAGINPFLHWVNYGRHEKRPAVPYFRQPDYAPLVSVIVPNYNHARFLEQRLRSIFDQTYREIELIVLDDASTDDSREVIGQLLRDCPFPCRTAFNEVGTGNPFRQWQRGIAMATGELIWICESDDFADPRFLEHLVPSFAEMSVKMALGRIEFAAQDGSPMAGMANFREGAEAGIWHQPVSRPAAHWFRSAFATRNIVTNVGGCVFRNQTIDLEIFDRAAQYQIAGDWFLYIHLLGSGKLSYSPDAVAWFRQHERNTSARNFDKLYYYDECWAVQQEIRRYWQVRPDAGARFVEDLAHQYRHFRVAEQHGAFEDRYSLDRLAPPEPRQPHVAIGFLGFETGGGELFPILLANEFAAQGVMVSLLAVNLTDRNADMMARLDPRVPVYSRDDVVTKNKVDFLTRAGVDVVHSHSVLIDNLFFERGAVIDTPYVVSMHGSHNLPGGVLDTLLFRSLRNVDYWVYTAEKNLDIFAGIPLDQSRFIKLPNGMPRDERKAPMSRENLGIGAQAVVFTFVARGIQRKGWRVAVEAFKQVSARHPEREMHLLMIGEGMFADTARQLAGGNPAIHFLGYQSCINAIYRMSDCALVPTRFEGESFPLCVIQALQEGTPVLGNDVGEIRDMLTGPNGVAGVVTDNMRDTAAFTQQVAEAMALFLDADFRATASALTADVAGRFSMEVCAAAYREIYQQAIAAHA